MTDSIRHFIDICDIDPRVIRQMIDHAHARKKARGDRLKGAKDDDAPLDGVSLGMVFEKPSTRTRISFEQAIKQLGGTSLILQGDAMQLGRGETVEDTARVISRMMDAVMIRAKDHGSVVRFAEWGSIPVINALTDRSHPCQLMADVMTFEEQRGTVEGATIAWIGDGNNMAQSLIETAVALNFSVVLASPEGFTLDGQAVSGARAQGASITLTDDPHAAVQGADAVMTDTWVSMGDGNLEARKAALSRFQVNENLMAKAPKDALFFHCLPAHRGEEVTDAVIDGPQSIVWDQAENRLHAQKAILLWCLIGEAALTI